MCWDVNGVSTGRQLLPFRRSAVLENHCCSSKRRYAPLDTGLTSQKTWNLLFLSLPYPLYDTILAKCDNILVNPVLLFVARGLVICLLNLQNRFIVLVRLCGIYVNYGEMTVAVRFVLLACRRVSVMYASFNYNACFSTFMRIILEASCVKMFFKNHEIFSSPGCVLLSFRAGWLILLHMFNSARPSDSGTVMLKNLHFCI